MKQTLQPDPERVRASIAKMEQWRGRQDRAAQIEAANRQRQIDSRQEAYERFALGLFATVGILTVVGIGGLLIAIEYLGPIALP